MTKRRKRRIWSDDEKRLIVGQTRVPGVSVSQVARRYDVNANLVFKWLRDPRFQAVDEDAVFLPVEVSQVPAPAIDRLSGPEVADASIELELPGGHRLILSGAFDPDRVVRLVRGLTT
jgi:transposase